MDDNSDFDSSIGFDRNVAEASAAWQAKHFPQVAVSLGEGVANFRSVTETFRQPSDAVEEFLAYQTRFARGMDDRTRGAHLVAFYSHHLGIAAGALYLKTRMVADLAPQSLALRFEPYGRDDVSPPDVPTNARRLHFCFSRRVQGPNGALAFHDAFVESLAPVIETLYLRTGLSRAAQWRLAADGLAGAFLEIGRAAGGEEDAMASALAIVQRKGSPLHSDVLRFAWVEGMRGSVPVSRFFRLRSGCCLYYRTQGGDFCDVCVLLEEQTQKSRLRACIERPDG